MLFDSGLRKNLRTIKTAGATFLFRPFGTLAGGSTFPPRLSRVVWRQHWPHPLVPKMSKPGLRLCFNKQDWLCSLRSWRIGRPMRHSLVDCRCPVCGRRLNYQSRATRSKNDGDT